MSVEFSKVKPKNIRTQTNTPGGDTYFIVLPGERVERALCFRRKKKEPLQRCTNPAGYGTWHDGTGACKFHGGSASIHPNVQTGRFAVVTKTRLADQINQYLMMDRAKLLDLTHELAAMRVIFDEFLNTFPDTNDQDYGVALNRCVNIIGTLGSLAEKMSRIETRNTLTAAQVLYLRATVADILMRYLTDPADREKAAKELAARLGGDVEVNDMKPSEVYLLESDGVAND